MASRLPLRHALGGLFLLAVPVAGRAQNPAPIDLQSLAPRVDSFVVRVQGTPIGFQRTRIERTDSGFRVIDDAHIGPAVEQHTEVELAADGTVRATRQTGTVRGLATHIAIDYRNGRATGTATVPSATGTTTIAVDTSIAPGTIDDNLITALIGAMPWAPEASVTLPVFLSGKGYTQAMTASVVGTETVDVPAGTFECYRIELTGAQAPVTMYVTTAAPRRLVKIAPQGAPLEFVLAS